MNEKELSIINKLTSNKVFTLVDETFDVNTLYFKVKLNGIKPMISIGEWKDYIKCEIEIIKIEGLYSGVFKMFPKVYLRGEKYSFLESLMNRISWELTNDLKIFGNVSFLVEKLVFSEDMIIDNKGNDRLENITEQKVSRNIIRNVIRDITNILKLNEEGEYNLPFDINGQDEYEFEGFPSFNLLFETIQKESYEEPKGYDINADYVIGENKIEVLVIYDKDKLKQSLYNIIGDLNDYISHELQHLRQENESRMDTDEFLGSNKDYFLQPDEIEAQYYGFKNKSKITKKSMSDLIDEWFNYNAEKFDLSGQDIKEIKDAILSFR